MNKYTLILVILSLLNFKTQAKEQTPIYINSKAKEVLKKVDKTDLNTYKISKPEYSENKANYLLDEFIPDASRQKINKGNVFHFNHGTKSFKFFKSSGSYRFTDKEVQDDLSILSSKTTDAIETLKNDLYPEAEKLLVKILDSDASQFQFMNCEYHYIAMGPEDENQFIKTITYRFVRVKDELPIVGSTNQVKITLDSKGRLEGFIVKDYKIEQYRKVRRKVKNNQLEKYLKKELKKSRYTKKPDGKDYEFVKNEVVDCISSYLPVKFLKNQLLLPHAFFKIKCQKVTGKNRKLTVYLPLDAEFAEGIELEDVIELEPIDR